MQRLPRSVKIQTLSKNSRLLAPLALPASRTFSSTAPRASAVSSADLTNYGLKHVGKGVSRLSNAVMASGKGSYITLEDGRTMLDFTTGIGVTGLGVLSSFVSFLCVFVLY